MKRGEIYYADLSPVIGSEQGGFRPVVIIQNDVGNKYAPTTIVAPLTTARKKNYADPCGYPFRFTVLFPLFVGTSADNR